MSNQSGDRAKSPCNLQPQKPWPSNTASTCSFPARCECGAGVLSCVNDQSGTESAHTDFVPVCECGLTSKEQFPTFLFTYNGTYSIKIGQKDSLFFIHTVQPFLFRWLTVAKEK